jgi:hypothetical protein
VGGPGVGVGGGGGVGGVWEDTQERAVGILTALSF